MRIPASIVGTTAGPREHVVDARWLMAYAAALGESAPEYFDTTRPGGIVAHPLFPVCYEWPLARDSRGGVVPDDVAARAVHATHHLTVHRPPRAGDRLRSTATVAALERRTPGAYLLLRVETVDAAGQPVTSTEYGSLYLGVDCEGTPPLPGGERERTPNEGWAWSAEVPVAPTLAHVYTECARIWNPIHTDRAVAVAAGLPDIILHGTATLALAISEILRRQPRGGATSVKSVGCRFGAMVRLPSRLVVRGAPMEPSPAGGVVRFEALGEDGGAALRDARLTLEA